MDSIGLDIKPLSPEHALMNYLTGGPNATGYKKIHNYRYWLRHEIFGWFNLEEQGIPPCRRIIDINKGDYYEPATRSDYVAVKTKYYLRMHYLPWFNSDQSGIGKVDLDKMAKMVMEHPDIRGLLTAKKDEMPRNI